MSRMPSPPNNAAFTLAEVMIVVAILSILVSVAIPNVNEALRDSKAAECSAHLREIEAAKDAYALDHPGAETVTAAQLMPYMKYRDSLPACPVGGTYSHVEDLHILVACSNNYPGSGPLSAYPNEIQKANGSLGAAPEVYSHNGYHDLGVKK